MARTKQHERLQASRRACLSSQHPSRKKKKPPPPPHVRCRIRHKKLMSRIQDGGDLTLLNKSAQCRISGRVLLDANSGVRFERDFISAAHQVIQASILKIVRAAYCITTSKRYVGKESGEVKPVSVKLLGSHLLPAFKQWSEDNCPDAFERFEQRAVDNKPHLISFCETEAAYHNVMRKHPSQWQDASVYSSKLGLFNQ